MVVLITYQEIREHHLRNEEPVMSGSILASLFAGRLVPQCCGTRPDLAMTLSLGPLEFYTLTKSFSYQPVGKYRPPPPPPKQIKRHSGLLPPPLSTISESLSRTFIYTLSLSLSHTHTHTHMHAHTHTYLYTHTYTHTHTHTHTHIHTHTHTHTHTTHTHTHN